jgi:hypothetical protein
VTNYRVSCNFPDELTNTVANGPAVVIRGCKLLHIVMIMVDTHHDVIKRDVSQSLKRVPVVTGVLSTRLLGSINQRRT